MNTPADRLLTVREVAERLSVPVSWVYARVEDPTCDLPHLKIGHYVRFEKGAIEDFLSRSRRAIGKQAMTRTR
jgi:excisionase family DNA binding protein